MSGREQVSFDSEGTTVRGWLYLPATEPGTGHPVVVMAHGFGAVKEQFLDRFAEVFRDAGLAALVFDYRYSGASDGVPRDDVDPQRQIVDYRNAISYARSRAELDPQRVGIWGTSFSGGHVLVAAATDPRVRCVVAQVPTINGYTAFQRRISPDQVAMIEQRLVADWENTAGGAPPAVVPLIEDGSQRHPVFATSDAVEFFRNPGAAPATWSNQVTLRSMGRAREYEPERFVARIGPVPLLMIVAEADTVTLTDLALAAYERAVEPKRLVLLPGGHFSPYLEQFDRASSAAREWFRQHLLGAA